MTKLSCKKLQLLLSIDETNEISDFPSPSLPANFRSSAPPNLFPINKSKRTKTGVSKTADRNATEKDGNLSKKINFASAESPTSCNHRQNTFCFKIPSKYVDTLGIGLVEKEDINSANEKDVLLVQRDKIRSIEMDSTKNSAHNKKPVRAEKNFPNLQNNCTGSDSSSLFYTFERHGKRSSKPTIVCTYFGQK